MTENREILQAIFEKIKAYDRIFLFRHLRCDGDCVGATKGLKEILRDSFPEKEIILTDGQKSDYLAFLGEDDPAVPEDAYRDALGIVIDTANTARISNQNFSLCREVIKIDHHIETEPFGDLRWVEEHRSSACEMIVTFYDTFRDELTLSGDAALYLYTGMVTDSGRFRYEGVTGETLRCAGILLDRGIDTDTLFAHLYLTDADYFKFKAYMTGRIKFTEHGVAYLYLTRGMQKKFGLSHEEASNVISLLDGIKGSLIWLAFIENPGEKDIRVRLRSRFVTVNEIAEHYHGGGHACASGATVYSKKEAQALIREADAVLADYKATHEGWL
ncbi:MAG: bifunctional oligoribonuclease/PAP phosphatase NrnA [Eubacteriales bacterium]